MKFAGDYRVTSGLLVVALAVGGAGLSFPLLQTLLGLCAVGACAYFALIPEPRLSGYALGARALAAAALSITALQLAPLPPSLWSHLPGREFAVQLDAMLKQRVWRPWTLDVEATVRSLLTLFVPVAFLFGLLRLSTPQRVRLLWIVVGFALFNALLGIVELSTGGKLTPYSSAHLGYPVGLFVNRNHNAALLLVSIPLTAVLGALEIARGRARVPTIAVTLSLIVVLALVIDGTTSRMGLLLLPLALAASLFLLFLGQSIWRLALPSILALAGVAVLVFSSGSLNRTWTRFSSLHDARFDFWSDVYWAIGHYGLAGTGFGTFVPVHQSAESLAAVTPAILNHAHNDYIEILLEGGLPGIALLVIFFGFLGLCAVRLTRSRINAERALVSVAAATGIFLLLVFSLVDYPLRMPALSCVFALLCTFLLPKTHAATPRELVAIESGRTAEQAAVRKPRQAPLRIALCLLLGVTGILVIQAGVSSHELLAQRNFSAARWAPWSTEAHDRAATDALLQGKASVALGQARSAIRLSPISAPAVRTLGLIAIGEGAYDAGGRLMQAAATLGWRDLMTQLWAIDIAKRSGEPAKAVERAEALYQQHQFGAPTVALLADPVSPAVQTLFVRDLAKQPEWRRDLLRSGAQLRDPFLERFEGLLVDVAATSGGVTTDETGPVTERLLALGRIDAARRLWIAVHGSRLLLNGDFERTDTGRGADLPADWDISDEDVSALNVGRPEFAQGDRALRIFDTRGSAPIVSQRLMLEPGTYSVRYRVHSSPGAASMLRWELRCLDSGQDIVVDASPAGAPSWEQISGNLTVPNQNCPVQRLALKRLGDIHPHELWIDDVVLSRQPR